MLLQLFKMGVKPEALLLPRRPDRGNPRMSSLDSLQALLDVSIVRCNYGDISRHKEVGGAANPQGFCFTHIRWEGDVKLQALIDVLVGTADCPQHEPSW